MDQRDVGPARVRGNNWRDLAVTPSASFEPQLPASVIVTYFEAPEALALTLAALEGQTYPRRLFEVVIVDDGSQTPLSLTGDSPLNIRVIHQEDRGFGLARARNTGARAAAHEILVFLDCDMMPEAGWLAEHARWHHAANDALTLGFRAHVEVDGLDAAAVRAKAGSLEELLADRPSDRPQWIEFHMTRTRELTSDDDDLFRMVTGGNLGVSRSFFEEVGGYDETFTQWGAEDTEFGYRAFTMGGLLVPAQDALCWHQGTGTAPSGDETASLDLQQAKISQLIAHPGFRKTASGRSFTVPQYVVTVESGSPDNQMSTAERVLANGIHDLVVWVAEPDDPAALREPGRERIRRLLGGDPRVRFGPSGDAPSQFPTAAFHISVPSGAVVKSDDVDRLRRKLRGSARAGIKLPEGLTAEIVRTRALNRALRSGIGVDEHHRGNQPRPIHTWFGAAREARHLRSLGDGPDLASLFLSRACRAAGWRIRRVSRRLRWAARRRLRGLKRLRRKLLWAARRRLRGLERLPLRLYGPARRRPPSARRPASRSGGIAGQAGAGSEALETATYRLGPQIAACGPRAEAVLASSSWVSSEIGEFTEAVIVDTSQMAADLGAGAVAAVVVLADLDPRASVPAFDAERLNPLGWDIDHRGHAAALGPPDELPRSIRTRRTATVADRSACRLAHHVVDTAAYHPDAVARAATLAALAATGAVVHIADKDAELHHRLGAELYGLMADEDVLTADQQQREAFSVAMRRAALRDHSLRARTRQLLAGTGLCGPALPEVSILLATRRADRLASALDAVAAQTYPRVELVLALHGDGFDRAAVDDRLQDLECPVRVVEAPEHLPLGAVLNAACEASSGSLLTKFDDDDIYGPEHLWDLVLAQEYSKAPLVGKGAEFVYLAGSDVTLRRFRGGGERYITGQSIAGGTLMISRHCLDAVLGWRSIPRGVDKALIEDVLSAGQRVYRTHGMGYVLVRHGEGHTWQADDDYFLTQAHETRAGCDPAFAGVSPPH